MSPVAPVTTIRHRAFEEVPGIPLEEAHLTDHQRLSLLLQGAAALAILDSADWHLSSGWRGAAVGDDGRLRLPAPVAGSGSGLPQQALRQLVGTLFGSRDRIAGRGQSRKAVKKLLELWRQSLTPLSPGRALGQILEAAPFLWTPSFADARRSLVGELRRGDTWDLWVAGEDPFRRRLLARGRTRGALEDLLAGEEGEKLWNASGDGDPLQLAAAGRWSTALRAWEKEKNPAASRRLAFANALFDGGQFEKALSVLKASRSRDARIKRADCQFRLGRWHAAAATLRRLEDGKLDDLQILAAAEIAGRLSSNLGDGSTIERWRKRTLAAGERLGGRGRLRAHLVAAGIAWDLGETERVAEHLAAAKDAEKDPELGWKWYQAVSLQAQTAGRGDEVVEALGRALGCHRRRLRPFEAAALWNDLGIGRAQQGDLAGAERAFLHAQRLMSGCEGPRRKTLALFNLAEIRLRRGRLGGVREILEQSTVENRLVANLRGGVHDDELWARYELVLGRPAAAHSHLRRALDRLEEAELQWQREDLLILSARALGWMGEPRRAAAALAPIDRDTSACLEPEEWPALWAHAGERARALAAAVGTPLEDLWQAVLSGEAVATPRWSALEGLEGFRAARMVFDVELLAPGAAPPKWRRRAVDELFRVGATAMAEQLLARDAGPWVALRRYLEDGRGQVDSMARLLADAGAPEASLVWVPEEAGLGEREVLIGADRGEVELSHPLERGSLLLRCGRQDELTRLLLSVIAADFEPPAPGRRRRVGRGGILGESSVLAKALDRLERLAASEVPVLIQGESGTGKELAARHLHQSSPRNAGPFVAVNCAALSETLVLSDLFGHVRGSFTGADRDRAGIFETARGGTVFLDEVGDLPATAQGMLLRVLQEHEVRRLGESLPRKVDIRVVTATHRSLDEMVTEGDFRKDLFFRLKVGLIHLPPLRERGRDVLILAERFLSEGTRLSAKARARLLGYGWPGNVRELKNVLSVAAALCEGKVIETEHLDLEEAAPLPEADYHQQLEAFRRRLVGDTLRGCNGNRAEAARRLGLTRQALSYLVRQLRLA